MGNFQLTQDDPTDTARTSVEDEFHAVMERIYTLQEVDPSTIKRMGGGDFDASQDGEKVASKDRVSNPFLQKSKEQKGKQFLDLPSKPDRDQLELDLGLEGQEQCDAFLLSEPIEVLGLSAQTRKALHSYRFATIKDLYYPFSGKTSFSSSLGQGHIDEAYQKWSAYVANKPLFAVSSIDWLSFLKAIVAQCDQIKIFHFLSRHRLQAVCALTPYEAAQAKKIKEEEKEEIYREVVSWISLPEKQAFVRDMWKKIFRVFVLPWGRKRGGILTKQEVYERLEQVSCSADSLNEVIAFFQHYYFQDRSLFQECLIELDRGVFAVDSIACKHYSTVIAKAKTYFYRPRVWYHFSDLITFLLREFAQQWDAFHESYLERVLRISPLFRVWKGEDGMKRIRR